MTIFCGRRAILALTVLGSLLAEGAACAQRPFTITRVDKNDLHAKASLSGLHWAPKTRTIFATTLDGTLASWTLPVSFDQWAVVAQPDRYPADPLASFLVTGTSYELLTAGFARQPRVGWAAGANVGDFDIKNVKAVYPHLKLPYIAVRCSDQLVLLDAKGEATTPAPLKKPFALLTWTDGSGNTSWLTAYDDKAGQLLTWKVGTWTDDSQFTIYLPPPATGDGGMSEMLTAITQGTSDGTFVTGDKSGMLRTWRASAPTTPQPVSLDPVDAAVFSRDGTALVQYEGEKVVLRLPFEGKEPVALTAPKQTPTSLRHVKRGDKHFAAGAWSADGAQVPRVDLFRFEKKDSSTLKPPDGTKGQVKALDISPVEDQDRVAGAIPGKGLVVFADPALAAPPQMTDDDAIVEIRYSSDGKWLVAVGKFVNLYDKDGTLLAQSKPLIPMGADVSVTACDVQLDKSADDKPPASGRLLLGRSDGQLSFWKLQFKSDSVPVENPASVQLAKSPIRRVVLNGGRALVTTDDDAIVWQLNEAATDKSRVLLPLERLGATEAILACALPSETEAVYRVSGKAVKRSLFAARIDFCNAKPLKNIANRGSDLLIAADADGTLFAKTATGVKKVDNKDAVSDLAISDDGQTILAGLGLAQGTLRKWKITGGVPSQPTDFTIPGGQTTSVVFGQAVGAVYAGTTTGAISRVQWPAGAARRVDLQISEASHGVVQLARLPESVTNTMGNPDRLLVVDKDGKLSLRWTVDRFKGPLLQNVSELYPTPWYGAAFSPASLSPDRRSVAIVSAAGQVYTASWPFPRHLKGYCPDGQDVSFDPFIKDAKPSSSPLYAVVWSDKFRTPVPATSPIVAGADGQLHVPADKQWKSIDLSEETPRRPVYALAAHPAHPVLAVGFGTRPDSPAGQREWLSVWPEDTTGFSKAKSKPWNGHKGPIRALAFSEDGKRLASVDDTGLLIVWDCGSLSPTNVAQPRFTEFPIGTVKPTSLVWLGTTVPDSLAVGLSDGQLWVLNVK